MCMVKDRVSVLIPARNEIFLNKTINDLLTKAKGDIEIIAVLDGYWPTYFRVTGGKEETLFQQEMIENPKLIYLHHGESKGMRTAINHAAQIATGEFFMKSDAHCMYDEGFDLKLKADIKEYKNDEGDDNWIVIPRRERLDAEEWKIQETGKVPVDYEYLSSPAGNGVKGNKWDERTRARMDILIDENLSFQGSNWFMTANHFLNRLGGMQTEGYGDFVREAQELGLKTWLSGGRVYTNKKTWYAHLHKGRTYGRMYFISQPKMLEGEKFCDDFWFNNRWKEAKYDMAWLIERFAPVPTWTPELIESVRKK